MARCERSLRVSGLWWRSMSVFRGVGADTLTSSQQVSGKESHETARSRAAASAGGLATPYGSVVCLVSKSYDTH